MIRSITRWCVLGVTVCLASGSIAAAQELRRSGILPVNTVPTEYGQLHGVIRDDDGAPLGGAVISAVGSTAAFALSDAEGRFAFRSLPPGTYLVRVHLVGYVAPRGRYVQVDAGGRQVRTISLDRVVPDDEPAVLAAGVGPVEETADAGAPAPQPSDDEVAWRLRHLKRGVLKNAGLGTLDYDDMPLEGVRASLGRAVGSPARLASALFADLTLNGQVNLLTTTSFDRPQDLFSMQGGTPRPIAHVSVVAPTADGDWRVRGSMTEGDISSWILAGSFTRSGTSRHQYEAGASYATQRYQGGNPEALAAMRDGSRYAGELYASDVWAITPGVELGVGGRYATYGYLTDRALLSGHFSVGFQPSRTDPLRLRLSVAHREIAPGAEEFVPPSTGLWLPPERTFSEVSRGAFTPERLDHMEVAGEREIPGHLILGVRAFRQRIDDQLVTVFGMGVPQSAATLGHYLVGTAGDFQAYGWGVSVTRAVNAGTEASVAYTQVDADPRGESDTVDSLMRISPSLLRGQERVHDLTASVSSRLSMTATRVFVVYKLNSAYADALASAPGLAARFEVQVNQEIPFLDFTGASWEMLVGVRNLFRSDLFDGSIYDELLVIHPPKRVMGGVTVRF